MVRKIVDIVRKLPYDMVIIITMINQKNIIEFSDEKLSHEINEMRSKTQEKIW